MGFVDWIKNRQANQQQSVAQNTQEQKPETAKQMYNREDAEQKANRIAPTPDQEARAQKIGEELRKPSQDPGERGSAPSHAPAPSESGGNAAQRQNQSHQDKAQKALSPTDDAAGKTAAQEKQPRQEKPPAQEKPKGRAPQTVPRRAPSWERC